MELFHKAQGNQNLLHLFTANRFHLTLAYLDIFEALNLLNQHLQGSHTSCIDHCDSICAFIEKLELLFRRVQRGNATSFSNLDGALEKNKVNANAELKAEIEAYL